MNLEEFKQALNTTESLVFHLPNGGVVPKHVHLTELGKINKHFIDCGGTLRNEEVISIQLWNADDVDHELKPEKFLDIIALSESKLGINNVEIEVEYQTDTIGKYGLAFDGERFLLTSKQTACLAGDKCGIPAELLPSSRMKSSCCEPSSMCC